MISFWVCKNRKCFSFRPQIYDIVAPLIHSEGVKYRDLFQIPSGAYKSQELSQQIKDSTNQAEKGE